MPLSLSPAFVPAIFIVNAGKRGTSFVRISSVYAPAGKLPSVKAPTLVVHGRHDAIFPLAMAEEIKKGIRGAELAVFEESGHSPGLEEPERFNEVVGAFLTIPGAAPAKPSAAKPTPAPAPSRPEERKAEKAAEKAPQKKAAKPVPKKSEKSGKGPKKSRG